MIYGDNPDGNLLERAVRWVIILIVFVFDPLALSLVIAAQHSYRWLDDDLRHRKKEDEEEEEDKFKDTFLNTKLDEEDSKFLDEALGDIFTEAPYEPEEKSHAKDNVQQDVAEPDAVVGNDELETPLPVTDEHVKDLEYAEEAVEGSTGGESRSPEPQPVINTEGVTAHETEGGYVQYQGKAVSKDALKVMHPELFAQADAQSYAPNFGSSFPKIAKKGDVFVRVDVLPNRVYKFSGNRWIEINKEQTDSYLYDEEYLKYLIGKIDSGEYDIDLLAENERIQIEDYLTKNR